MFSEPRHILQSESPTGWIEVITGCMFSGKTEELIRRLNRALIARQKVEIFKPLLDTRYSSETVISHNQRTIRSTQVSFAEDILLLAGNSQVVGIDEVQFFDDYIVDVCEKLTDAGKRVIAAGLDMDFSGQPFGCMPQLLATAEYIHKMHAICMKCGGLATYSYRTVKEKAQVFVGEKESYEPRCRRCFRNDQ